MWTKHPDQQPQKKDAAGFPAGLGGAAEHPMVPLLMVQAHDPQGGADGLLTGGEDRARQQCLGVLLHAFGEQ